MKQQRGLAAINIFGLAIGVAVCVLIGLFVWQERTYDRFHEKGDRIYRAWIVEKFAEDAEARTFINTTTPAILGSSLTDHYPEIEAAVRVNGFESGNPVGPPDRRFDEPLHFVDPQFLEVFSFPLIRGNPETALAASGRAVITTDVAERYFPDRDPLGEILPISMEGEDRSYVVTGIVEPPPVASSIQFRILVPMADWEALVGESTLTSWHSVSVDTYVLARQGTSGEDLEQQFPSMVEGVVRQDFWDEYNVEYSIFLQPLADLNLGRTIPDEVAAVEYRQYLSLLTLIAIFVLLVAAINFVTLSLGQSTRRYREVGLRKSLGAQRVQVASQFWGEAFLLATLSIALGIVLAVVFAAPFRDLSGTAVDFGQWPRVLGLVVGLVIIIGLGAGAYPSLILARLGPIDALKDRLQLSGDRSLLRRALVVVQFGVAILLIIGTLFVGRQLDFLRSAPLGFGTEQTVIIPTGMALENMLPVLERFRELADGPAIEAVSASAFALNEPWAWGGYTDNRGTWRTLRTNWGEADFLEVAGVDLAAGRMLQRSLATDSMRIIVNEALVRDYGWDSAQDALGRSLPGAGIAEFEIAGVVRDFHFASLREPIEPLVYTINPGAFMGGMSDVSASASSLRKIFLRIGAANVPSTLATIRNTWVRSAPDVPFDYYFLDEAVQAQYVQEERLGRIAATATVLSIFIACLGLFGLATLTTVRRRKEVGVRKVLGASVAGIVALLSTDFLKLVGCAFLLAAPVAYLAVARWLGSFAYRIEPAMGVFLLSGVLAACVAFLAVSYHAFRAAVADPVYALRND